MSTGDDAALREWTDEHARQLALMREEAHDRKRTLSLPVGTARESRAAVERIHAFTNTRGCSHDNDCGQAAVATLVEHWRLNVHPEVPRTVADANIPDPMTRKPRMYPANNVFVDAIWRDYPTDAPFNAWTWKEQIAKALSGYGLSNVQIGHSVPFGNGADEWNEVRPWIDQGFPVVVLVDFGPLTGAFYGLHWTVLYKYENGNVHLTNMGGREVLDWKTFMEAWWCRGCPHPNNFVFITGQP